MTDTITITGRGRIDVYISDKFYKEKPFQWRHNISSIDYRYPEEVVMDAYMRTRLEGIMKDPDVTMSQELRDMFNSRLDEALSLEVPLMQPTDFELLAYIDTVDGLECDFPISGRGISVTAGKKYTFSSGQYKYTERFTRNKPMWDETTQQMVMNRHNMSREGVDRWLRFQDDDGKYHRFLAHPNTKAERDHSDDLMWTIFKRPDIKTVKEVMPDKYKKNMDLLDTHEILSNFDYYPGQKDFIARTGSKDFGLVAAETGCGKTLIAISLSIMKGAQRVLVIAPKGTVKGSDGQERVYDPAQWEQELIRFAPHYKVFHIFCKDDYYNIKEQYGDLPQGFYITYPDAMFNNQSRETLPKSWDEIKFRAEYGINIKTNLSIDYASGVGDVNSQGIRCVATPNLATITDGEFDMVVLDEAHLMQNIAAKKTQSFIRMQAPYRFALSATPIPNLVSDMFALMGWLCVPDWYKNYKRNVAWPFDSESLTRFSRTFLVQERDFTEEQLRGFYTPSGRKLRCVKASPIVASPARLLKLLKPTLSFIDKKRCNPALVNCEVKEVRVPMGDKQRKMYGYYTNRRNIPHVNPMVRAMVQQSYLRNACADPGSMNTPPFSNFNPKMIATLEIILECLEKKEQVVVVASRLGQSNELQDRLTQAGVRCSRIDSTVKSAHSAQCNAFKAGKTQVMIMGIKMAQAFSFSQCPNLIVTSLEWSYGSKNQALGRVYRLDSPKPVTIWCILNENSIEEVMFDRVASKADAATLCLRGERVTNSNTVLDASEVIGQHIVDYQDHGKTLPEDECEKQWPTLLQRLSIAI